MMMRHWNPTAQETVFVTWYMTTSRLLDRWRLTRRPAILFVSRRRVCDTSDVAGTPCVFSTWKHMRKDFHLILRLLARVRKTSVTKTDAHSSIHVTLFQNNFPASIKTAFFQEWERHLLYQIHQRILSYLHDAIAPNRQMDTYYQTYQQRQKTQLIAGYRKLYRVGTHSPTPLTWL